MQKARIGTTLMRTYIQMIQDSKIADRIALITFENLIPYYEKLGFENMGKSKVVFGAREFYDLVSCLPDFARS
jgi:predicted N-acetyltransferase YhbS